MTGPDRVAAADLLHQRRETLERDDRCADVGAALEARRGLGLEIEPLAGPADRRRLEVRALESHAARARRDFGAGAAHHAGNRLRPIAIGDDEHLGVELSLDAVERRDRLARLRAPDADFRAGELRQIEGVHGMAQLDEHVVGQIDDRADRPDAGRLQAPGHPGRRSAHASRRPPPPRTAGTGPASSIVTVSWSDAPVGQRLQRDFAPGRDADGSVSGRL